jgi:restriction endonuclease S subunit
MLLLSLYLFNLYVEEETFLDIYISSKQVIGNRFDLDLYNNRYTGLISLLKQKFPRISSLKAISYPITSGATPLGSTYTDKGIPFLRVQNIKDDGSVDLTDILFVSEQFAKTISRGAVENGDILLVIVGATIGKSAVAQNIESRTVTNQAIARIRLRNDAEIFPHFLQIFLNSQAGQIQINALKRPVAQGNLSLTEAGQILVPLIDFEKQELIIAEVIHRRSQAAQLRREAETVVAAAKARVERMILGEEDPKGLKDL